MSSNIGKKIIEGKREKYFIYDKIIMDYMDKMMNISKEINELTEKKRKYIINEYIEKIKKCIDCKEFDYAFTIYSSLICALYDSKAEI